MFLFARRGGCLFRAHWSRLEALEAPFGDTQLRVPVPADCTVAVDTVLEVEGRVMYWLEPELAYQWEVEREVPVVPEGRPFAQIPKLLM